MTVAAGPLTLLESALDQGASLVDAVDPAQLEQPTPCVEWTVRALLNHMVGGLQRFTDLVGRNPVEWGHDGDRPEEDWGTAYRAQAGALTDAWHAAGALECTYPFMGSEAPAASLINFQLIEISLHSWDLARAISRTDGLNTALAEVALDSMKGVLKPEMRGRAFAPEASAPAGADAYARLAAFSGRPM